MASTFAVEAELKSKPQKVWESIKDFTNLFPKIIPQVFASVVALEGDGKSPGSVRRITYAEGIHGLTPSIGQKPLGPYNYAKGEQLTLTQKIESVDEENKTMTYSVVDGDILKLYKSYQATFTVSSKGDGTLVIYSGVYEKQNEQVPDPGEFTGIVSKTLYGLDAYLLQA